jgi:predicted RNase H-like nuclease (RuvC/YqgF family)
MKQVTHNQRSHRYTQQISLVKSIALGFTLLTLVPACSDKGGATVEPRDASSQSTETSEASEQASNLLKIEKAKVTLSPEQQQNNVINQVKALSHSNTIQIESLSQTLEQMKQEVQQIEEKVQQIKLAIKVSNEKDRESLLDLQAQINALVEKQKVLTVSRGEKKRVKKSRVRGKGYYLPTFHLASIDQWGDEVIVVVSQNNQLHELRSGQAFDQWQVESIDVEQVSVVFKSPYGVRKTLYIQS